MIVYHVISVVPWSRGLYLLSIGLAIRFYFMHITSSECFQQWAGVLGGVRSGHDVSVCWISASMEPLLVASCKVGEHHHAVISYFTEFQEVLAKLTNPVLLALNIVFIIYDCFPFILFISSLKNSCNVFWSYIESLVPILSKWPSLP